MQDFAVLLDSLLFTPGRNAKLRLLANYLRTTADPDRGWALAALTGGLDIKAVRPGLLKQLMAERVDPVLFSLSHDFVGDMAETISLLWPEHPQTVTSLSLAQIIDTLSGLSRAAAPASVATLLDSLDPQGRYALIKLATGALRIGVSARLARTGLAQAFNLDVEEIEEIWHGLTPPYAELFRWAEGKAPRPAPSGLPMFRPFMLAQPLEAEALDLATHVAEWKWDGIRVQVIHAGGDTRLYSRSGDDITSSFPDVARAFTTPAALDGELLVRGPQGEVASFNALQQRLGRKSPSVRLLADAPAFVRLYDALAIAGEDLRTQPWHRRRAALETLVPALDPSRFDLSPLVEAADWRSLAALRAAARDAGIEGLMLKHRDSPYVPGRRSGLWYKWKREALTADCVLMYAQRGHGKRSSYHSDFTFGAWAADGTLLPVGKAYSGFTDAELKELDRWVRAHTVARYGPVREVEKTYVVEVAFDSLHRSTRHKSGLAMRFPRIHRLRPDKPAHEADTLESLARLVT
jgi:DNA ligase-1